MFVFRVDVRVSCSCFVFVFVSCRVGVVQFVFVSCSCHMFRVRVSVKTNLNTTLTSSPDCVKVTLHDVSHANNNREAVVVCCKSALRASEMRKKLEIFDFNIFSKFASS